MFENFTRIPETEEDLVVMNSTFSDMIYKLKPVINDEKYHHIQATNYYLRALAQIAVMLESLSVNKTGRATILYYDNGNYGLKNFSDEMTTDYGLVINEEASTHFDISDYPTATFLPAVESYLKQTPQHFLKIFTRPNHEKLFVWTNKPILPLTLFRLLELRAKMFPRTNPVSDAAIKAFLDKDAEAFKKVIIDYLTSDAVTEEKFRQFAACITNTNDRQIQTLERNIEGARENIQYFEQEIVNAATNIRTWNENIEFLKTQKNKDEETKLLFKYLLKNPYITQFEPKSGRSRILFKYEAPMIYFAEHPAEKHLTKGYLSGSQKEILKIFLGRKYELITKCALYFDTATFKVEVADRELDDTKPLLPHPHLMRFHCFGNHTSAIRAAAEEGNYFGAVEQLSQAIMNINFYDSCVVNEMLMNLENNMYTYVTWRHKETGIMYTTAEVFERNDYYEET